MDRAAIRCWLDLSSCPRLLDFTQLGVKRHSEGDRYGGRLRQTAHEIQVDEQFPFQRGDEVPRAIVVRPEQVAHALPFGRTPTRFLHHVVRRPDALFPHQRCASAYIARAEHGSRGARRTRSRPGFAGVVTRPLFARRIDRLPAAGVPENLRYSLATIFNQVDVLARRKALPDADVPAARNFDDVADEVFEERRVETRLARFLEHGRDVWGARARTSARTSAARISGAARSDSGGSGVFPPASRLPCAPRTRSDSLRRAYTRNKRAIHVSAQLLERRKRRPGHGGRLCRKDMRAAAEWRSRAGGP